MVKKVRNKKSTAIIVGSVLTAAIVCGAVGYVLAVQNNVSKWTNKIYPGIAVEGIDLSGMNETEAKTILKSKVENNVNKKVITATKDSKSYELKYSEINPKFNIEDTVKTALNEGKSKGLFEKNGIIKSGINKKISLEFSYDESTLKKFEQKISSELNVKAKDASLVITGGNMSITSEATGIEVDKDKLHKLLKESISSDLSKQSKIDIPMNVIQPKATKAALSKIDGIISSFSTTYNPAQTDRSENLAIAAKKVNGTVVMPGEIFSYNDTVGERTTEAGFKNGAIFKDNKVVQDVGGGVCQVSTTLYRAVMSAGIKSVERHNHSLKASYSDLGLDATVYWGSLDYKFKNTYDFPIYLEGYTTSNQVVFNVYGNKAGKGSKNYDIVAETVKTLEPEVQTINDPSIDAGQVVWDTNPVVGYVVKSYRVTTDASGNQIAKEFIATDTYSKVNGVKRVGTKKAN